MLRVIVHASSFELDEQACGISPVQCKAPLCENIHPLSILLHNTFATVSTSDDGDDTRISTTEPDYYIQRQLSPTIALGSGLPYNLDTKSSSTGNPSESALSLKDGSASDVPCPLAHHWCKDEWIPSSLKKSWAATVSAACLVFIVLLAVLDVVARRSGGFPTDSSAIVSTARYLPTVVVIIFGFVWKELATDVKRIMPWSTMFTRWASASDSIFLNYMDSLELSSVWVSARKKHWAVCLALVGGFLSGALVPLANTLTFVDLFSRSSYSATLQRTSGFNFQDTLGLANGTILLPWNYTGNKPYAAIASIHQANGKPPAWTSDTYAFESFSSTSRAFDNFSLSADVKAFSAALLCQSVRYELGGYAADTSATVQLFANTDDLGVADCRQPLTQEVQLPFGTLSLSWTAKWKHNTTDPDQPPAAWLNLTSCSPGGSDDIRLLITLLQPFGVPPEERAPTNADVYRATGLICRPQYYDLEVGVTVNGSTGEVLNYTPKEDTRNVFDIGTTPAVIQAYLNNPLDGSSQYLYSNAWKGGPFNPDELPTFNLSNDINYASINFAKYGIDPFNDLLLRTTNRPISAYFDDSTVLANDVSKLFSSMTVQIVNAQSRRNETDLISGSVLTVAPRLLVRQSSLRAMQAAFFVLALICCLCATILRPRTCLREDPSSLGAMAVLLASNVSAEMRCIGDGLSKERTTRQVFRVSRCRMSRNQDTDPFIEVFGTVNKDRESQLVSLR